MTDYKANHEAATKAPRSNYESAIVAMLQGFTMYELAHQRHFDERIGEDYVLGREWRDLGLAIIGLLNGETGRLDCGTIDGLIRQAFLRNGFTDEGRDPKSGQL